MQTDQHTFIREARRRIYSNGKKEEHCFGPERPYEMLLNGKEEF